MRHVSKPSGSVQHGTLWLCPAKEVVSDRRMRHVWAGNHVVQRCLQKLDSNYNQFIYDAIAENCFNVASHRHGCCVFQVSCVLRSVLVYVLPAALPCRACLNLSGDDPRHARAHARASCHKCACANVACL